MFKTVRLSGKILWAVILALAATSIISFRITQNRINGQEEEAFRDKLRQIAGMATATRD